MPKLKIMMTFGVAILFVVVLLVYAMTFTVRFTESAVVTRFGEVHTEIEQPGLRFKWFYPIEGVTKYETTNRLAQARIETYQTRDDRQLIVGAFAIWRVKPEEVGTFYRRFSNAGPRAADQYRAAATLVEETLRSSMSALSAYTMSDLFTPNEGASKLEELEARVLAQMKSTLEGQGERAFGLEIVAAGVARTSLPQTTTEAALERMRQDRARIVTSLQERGASEAGAVRSQAESNAAKILAFAEARARQIRSRGDEEAARYLAQMTEVPGLAIYLKNLELLEEAMFSRATLLFSTDTPGLNLLDPGLFQTLEPGEIPGTRIFTGGQGEVRGSDSEGRGDE
ncbi:MAG: SPFH domain-containing protein [Phycisphaerales bacterium JB064]